jgi:hypothetical protein
VDTGQKTESILRLVEDIVKDNVTLTLPEFQRDFVWDIEKTFDLFDSFVCDIFVGSLIYGVPSFEITVRELDRRPRSGKGSRGSLKLTSYTREQIENRVKISGFRLLLDGQQRATSIYRAMTGVDPIFFIALNDDELELDAQAKQPGQRSLEQLLSEFRGEEVEGRVSIRLHDVYKTLNGEAAREKEKAALFLNSNKFDNITAENVEASQEFLTYLTQLKNLENLCRQEKFIAHVRSGPDQLACPYWVNSMRQMCQTRSSPRVFSWIACRSSTPMASAPALLTGATVPARPTQLSLTSLSRSRAISFIIATSNMRTVA